MKAIVNAQAVLPGRVEDACTILIDGGRIAAVGRGLPVPPDSERTDAAGAVVGPGFVDIHVHANGRGNKWWFQAPAEVAAYHLRRGSTAMCAYLGYDLSREELIAAAASVQRAIDQGLVPNVYGVGFEGPYINPAQGANTEKNGRRGPDPDEYLRLYDVCRGRVLQWMYAPEMDPDGRFAAFLQSRGITAAVGHSCASPAQIRAAADRGAVIATHLYDAMGCWRGDDSVSVTGTIQDSTAVGCLICPELTLEIIPDSLGIHVKPADMRLAYMLAGAGRIAVITDCCPCAYDPADYPAGHMRSAPDLNFNEKGELAGSMLTMDQALRNFRRHTGAPLQDLFRMTSTTPAKAVGIDRDVGSIAPGKFADLVFMDDSLRLQAVWFHGEAVR